MAHSSSVLTTVDKADIERHSKLSDWWSKKGSLRGLHTFNDLRIPYIVNNVVLTDEKRNSSKPLENKKILDVGCGGGIVSEALAKLGAQVTGVDASSTLIEMAKKHSASNADLQYNQPTYQCTSIEEHAQTFVNYYDAVVASEIVDHVANVDLFLDSCVQTLKPGGKIFITTPNKTQLSRFFGIFVAENILKLIPKGLHKYEKFKSPKEVTEILHKYNCEVNEVYGLLFNPITENWWWSYFQFLWYALVATKLST
ncbi:ubiquinone biosynthesis O-methyltransferase, mitochondrial-like [Zerene cesonia]|uniref:ubiquinone biosynthesis O-methyltransferase, mitochondrial-like n=1 Tax=Zerene cesonia TaxID=33412 RepID=UPI0018E4FCEF|nr:ubiquinone biosynthesis O-methyltransferase, mitochondrial-like [Zerene cesonia]